MKKRLKIAFPSQKPRCHSYQDSQDRYAFWNKGTCAIGEEIKTGSLIKICTLVERPLLESR